MIGPESRGRGSERGNWAARERGKAAGLQAGRSGSNGEKAGWAAGCSWAKKKERPGWFTGLG